MEEIAEGSLPPVVEPGALFARGRAFLDAEDRLEALRCFEAAYTARPDVAEHGSYFGLLLGEQRGLHKRARELCEAAVRREPKRVDLHLNLVRVHMAAGQKSLAVVAVRHGLDHLPDDVTLKATLSGLGLRRTPFFESLPRSHPLNKYLGMLTWRLGMR